MAGRIPRDTVQEEPPKRCPGRQRGEGRMRPGSRTPGTARWWAQPVRAQGPSVGEEMKEWKNHHIHSTDGKSLQPSSLPHPRGVNYTDRCTIWEVVQIFSFLIFFFFLRKRDAKPTLVMPCLVLGFHCWLWERRSQRCWHVVKDPDEPRACPWHLSPFS